MPDKDTKKNQQENTTPAVSATEDIQQQRKEALDKAIGQVTFNPDSTNIGSMEKAAIARQNLTDDQKRSLGVENAIHNTYSSPIQETSNRISEWETARNTLKAQDETAQRRGRSMQMIAGISDGLASLANLIGVGQGGTNIDMGTGSLTPLAQKIEAARQERKADIKSIDDRLDQYRNQLLQMQLAKGAALAQAQEKEAERAERKAAELRSFANQEKLAKLQIDAAAKGRQEGFAHDAKMQGERIKSQETISQNEIQARKDIAGMNAEADVNKYIIRYGNSAGKDKTQFVMNDPTTGNMRVINIADKSLNNILATYLPQAVKNGEITADEAEDAKNWRSNEVSKTNLLGMVNKSKTMRMALLTAVGEEAEQQEDKSGEQTPHYSGGQVPYYLSGSPLATVGSWQDAYPEPSKK